MKAVDRQLISLQIGKVTAGHICVDRMHSPQASLQRVQRRAIGASKEWL